MKNLYVYKAIPFLAEYCTFAEACSKANTVEDSSYPPDTLGYLVSNEDTDSYDPSFSHTFYTKEEFEQYHEEFVPPPKTKFINFSDACIEMHYGRNVTRQDFLGSCVKFDTTTNQFIISTSDVDSGTVYVPDSIDKENKEKNWLVVFDL